jgi:hypothetical protein
MCRVSPFPSKIIVTSLGDCTSVHSTVLPQHIEGLIERARVLDCDQDFQLCPVVDQPPAFCDV